MEIKLLKIKPDQAIISPNQEMARGQNIKFVKAGFLVKMDLQELRNHLHLRHKNLVEERKQNSEFLIGKT